MLPPHLNPETMKRFEKDEGVKASEALEYICWLVKADTLYDIALTTFDFDLVQMVAT